MREIDQLIEIVLSSSSVNQESRVAKSKKHSSLEEINAWEKAHSLFLPPDYRQFLLKVGECELHGILRFLPLQSISRVADFIYGNEPDAPILPESWFAIAILGDSDYTIMDLATVDGDAVNIIDGFHELAHESLEIIAKSFTEFFKRSIEDKDVSTGGGGGHGYWSTPGPNYGETEHG